MSFEIDQLTLLRKSRLQTYLAYFFFKTINGAKRDAQRLIHMDSICLVLFLTCKLFEMQMQAVLSEMRHVKLNAFQEEEKINIDS